MFCTNVDENVKRIIHDIIPKDRLCHYTSLKNLKSILSSKELWFSDIRKTRDETELVYFLNVIQKQAPLLLKSDSRFTIKQQNEKFFNDIFDAARKEILSTESYLFCLTNQCDTFSMWEASYGDQLKGVCIRFNKYNLIKILYNNFLFNKVFYGDQIIQSHQLFGEGSCILYNGFIPTQYKDISVFTTDLIMCSRFFKHYSFYPEEEYRFITLSPFKNYRTGEETYFYKDKNKKDKHILKVNFATLCVKYGVKIEDLFDEIIVGPKINTSAIESLKSFMADNGYTTLIKKTRISSCPIR